ncbi:MAG TPA: VCBS repeat-containing protein, partial [Burkholderiaceae bacterium]|nr:VCBS repeat-containing protein [Burkholderiaceae bacterium]
MGRGAAGRLAVLAAVLAACALCAGAWASWRHRHDVDMPATLQALARAEGAWDTPWDQQAAKIASLEAEQAHAADAGTRVTLEREIAMQELDGGHPDAAAARLEALLARWQGKLRPVDELMLQADLAFAYYRIGEQANCGPGIDTATCIVPIDPASIHRARLGAAEAARRYLALAEDPRPPPDEQLFFRWMLTLCQMQLGTWPDGVPAPLRIDAAAFHPDASLPRWTDVAAARGLREFGRAGGLILEDFDNDDHLDILVSHMGMTDPLHYWHNRGDGTFERQDERAGLGGLTGGLNMVQADYDNDGCIDVYIPRGAWQHDKGRIPGSLLHNNCDGTFTDVTGAAGVMNAYPSQVAVWADFNGDGLLDLFIGNEIVRPAVAWPEGTPNVRLFINQGDGTFVDRAREAGLRVDGMIKGAAADDYDNDGRPDLYVSVMGGPNHLFHNLGGNPPRFEDVTARAGVAAPDMSFATWFFDFDNDGWPDLYVSGYSARASD